MSSAQNHESSTSLLVHAQYSPRWHCAYLCTQIYYLQMIELIESLIPCILAFSYSHFRVLSPIAHCTLQSLDSFQYWNNWVCAMCSWDWKLWNVCMTFQFMTLRHNSICYCMICYNFSLVCTCVAPLVCMNSMAVTPSLPQWLQLTVQLSCTATHSQCS